MSSASAINNSKWGDKHGLFLFSSAISLAFTRPLFSLVDERLVRHYSGGMNMINMRPCASAMLMKQ